MPLEEARREKLFAAERNVAAVRLVVVLFNTLLYLLVMGKEGTVPWLAYLVIGVAVAYSVGVLGLQPYRRFPLLMSAYATSVTDGALITAWLVATGGYGSPFFLLWYISLVAVAFRFNLRATLATATLYAMLYLGVLFFAGGATSNLAEIATRTAYILFMGLLAGLLSRETLAHVRARLDIGNKFRHSQQEQQRLRSFLDAAPDPIVIVDGQGSLVFVNCEAEKVFQMARSDLAGSSLESLLPALPAHLAARGNPAYFSNASSKPTGPGPEVFAHCRDGSRIPMEVSLSPFDSGGRRMTIAILRDLRPRQQSERALQESEQRWRNLLENAPSIILTMGRDGRIRYVNRPIAPFDRKDLIGTSYLDCVQREERAKLRSTLDRVFELNQAESFETVCLGPDRTWSRYRGSLSPLVRHGRVEEAILMAVDVSDIKKTESIQAQLASIVQSSEEAIVGHTLDGTITSWNPGAMNLYGYTEREALGQAGNLLLPSDLMEAEHRIFQEAAAGAPQRYDSIRQRKDGTRVHVSMTVSPVRGADGAIVGVAAMAHDITDKIRSEQERTRNQERTLELERLREMDAFKTHFINTAAHELNTPLTPVRLQLYVLKRSLAKSKDPTQAKSVEILDRNIERLTALVQDVLEVARMQAGRFSVNKQYVDLDRVIDEAVESYQEPARQAGVRLVASLIRPLPVEADQKRLIQVMYNLLSNALKFTPRKGHVIVESWQEAETAFVRIRDSGQGLSPQQIERLFQPFSQVHDVADRSKGGTGLGLYICKGIVELHGGRIWCESRGAGMGTAFTLALPVAKAAVPEVPEQGASEGAGRRNSPITLEESFSRRARELI